MNELSVVERRDLQHHESVIERGLATFIDVGLSLKKIRDAKLYRESYGTFEKYVFERWGIDRSYAHRLIDASEVKEDLLPIGNKIPRAKEIVKESQLRELVDVPEDTIEEVVGKAVEIAGDEPITAKVLKQAREEIYKPEPVKQEPKQVDWRDLRTVAMRHMEAAVRAIDDLNGVKRFHDHPKAVKAVQSAMAFLRVIE